MSCNTPGETTCTQAYCDCGKRRNISASDSNELLSAAKAGAKWMRWWLEQNECDCEHIHTCGKIERKRELEQMEAAIAEAEGK